MKRTITGWALMAISWLIFFGGITVSLVYLNQESWERRVIFLIGAIILAIALRSLANIGEFLFNICGNSFYILKSISRIERSLGINYQESRDHSLNLDRQITSFNQHLESSRESLERNFSMIKESIDRNFQDIRSETILLKKESNSSANENLQCITEHLLQIKQLLDINSQDIRTTDQTLQQINCDSKDMNQNLFKLRSFLEEVEKHLDLKR